MRTILPLMTPPAIGPLTPPAIRSKATPVLPRRAWPAALVFLLLACGGGTSEPGGAHVIEAAQGDGQSAPVANMVPVTPAVIVREGGSPVSGVKVTFAVTAGDGWVVRDTVSTDANGRAAMPWYMGPRPGEQRLRASSAAGSVEFTATATALQPGHTYRGADDYIEFIAGDLPVVLSAPHGGTMAPASIPDRTYGTTVRDANTELLAIDIRDALITATGSAPFVIICHLRRIKLDANREIGEAAQGDPRAERAWREYHAFIEAARASVIDRWQRGFYIDLHGHGHPIQRLELGYMLSAQDLEQTDATLNTAALVQKSSLRALVQQSGTPHAELVRGPESLGALLAHRGFPAVPSPGDPNPGIEPFFSGGYNTGRHARDADHFSGLQIEANFTGVRDTQASRTGFAAALADALGVFFAAHFDAPLAGIPSAAR